MLKWVAIVVCVVVAIRGVLRNEYFALFHFFFAFCLVEAFSRVVPTYTIGDAGIKYIDGQRRAQLKWSEIEWYLISPEKDMPEMMRILFSSPKKTPVAFTFDPKEIGEDRLVHILELYLPEKELRNVVATSHPLA